MWAGGGQTSDTTMEMESSRTVIQASTPQHFQSWQTPSLDAWGQFVASVSSSLLSLSSCFSFSDDFQYVTRHETALLSARHPDEAASFALAAHADLKKKNIQFQTFKSGKYERTRSFPKNKSMLTQG